MSYNFTYPNNSSSWVITIVIGAVISVLVFILLYNNTNANYNWTEQRTASAQVDSDDLGCEVEEATEASTVAEQPSQSSTQATSTLPQSPSAYAPQQSETTTSNQQPSSTSQQHSQPQTAETDSRTYRLSDLDENPEFPGGMANLRTWLSDNLVYPAPALQHGIEGTVKVRFTVFKDGHAGNVSVIQSVETHLDAEAVRLVNKMPNWSPGILNGKHVNVTYDLPITFRM